MNEKVLNIGVILGDAHSSYSSSMMQGIYNAAEKFGVNVYFFIENHENIGDKLEHFFHHSNTTYKYFDFADIDVFIISISTICSFLTSCTKEEFIEQYSKKPYVLLEEASNKPMTSHIICDNYEGMATCIEHLIKDHDYRNIVFLAGPKENPEAMVREKAYRDVMAKYSLPVNDNMVAYGDFSSAVEHLVEGLLDNNDYVEAIVCANDEMATAAYRVCNNRNIRIGREIAITGFDDMEGSNLLSPPLTTVCQNTYEKGYKSVLCAIELYQQGKSMEVVQRTYFQRRRSCGCNTSFDYSSNIMPYNKSMTYEEYVDETSKGMVRDVSLITNNPIIVERHRKNINNILIDIIRTAKEANENESVTFNLNQLSKTFVDICRDNKELILERSSLAQYITEVLFNIIITLDKESARNKLMRVVHYINYVLYAFDTKEYLKKYMVSQSEKRIAPLKLRNMMEVVDDDQKLYETIMKSMKDEIIGKIYLFLLEEPIIYSSYRSFELGEKLFLAVKMDDGEITTFQEKKYIDRKNVFTDYFSNEGGHTVVCYSIFASDRHYGILVSDIPLEYNEKLYYSSLQIGTVMRFREITKMEKKARVEVEKHNRQLEVMSVMDELTKLYNRRGVLKQIELVCTSKSHNQGWIVVFDIDHLKQINDCFGHADGDFAIQSVANIMKQILPAGSIIGRTGGDEYIALVFDETPDFDKRFRDIIENKFEEFNKNSGKDYYVEISVGFKQIFFTDHINLQSMISEADMDMYTDKQKRRLDIRK